MAWIAHADRDFHYGDGALRIVKRGDGSLTEVTSLTMERREDGQMWPDPLLRGPDCVDFMQAVMDAAYEYGLRPSAAQDERHKNAHLEDMRRIAFHTLKMDNK